MTEVCETSPDGRSADAVDSSLKDLTLAGQANEHVEITEDPPPKEEDNADCIADFNPGTWDESQQMYGITGLLHCREAMLPAEKPSETEHLKFLIFPNVGEELGDGLDIQQRQRQNDRKARGRIRDKSGKSGRFVPEMGKTETLNTTQRGQCWRNIGADSITVIVRESFSLMSNELWSVPPGQYIQQAGPIEIFVTGQAAGLQRMPVQPRGWVTVDATAVGGPKYLEPVKVPRWRVVFSTGSSKGDIVVRDGVSLDSEEVAKLVCGTLVEQSGPQEFLDDGIIRMPNSFNDTTSSSPAGPSKPQVGWVTCDATAQGGPKFFETCPPEYEPEQSPESAIQPGGEDMQDSTQAAGETSRENVVSASWDKNRIWKVISLDEDGGRTLPLTARPEPYPPGSRKSPPADLVVRWLKNGDIVEQVGHSKKMRSYMVMPVRIDGKDGWVTRRSVDKSKDHPHEAWFVELRDDRETEREHRRTRTQQGDE